MAAGDARGSVDFFAAVPEDAGVFALPVDAEGLIDLDALASLDAAAAQDALVGVITIEGVGEVLFVWLVSEGARLMLYLEQRCGVVNGAIVVVVVTDGAVEHVVLEDAVEGLTLGDVDGLAGGFDGHAGSDLGAAGADEFSVHLNHAGVTALDGAHLGDVADLRNFLLDASGCSAVEEVEEKFTGAGRDVEAVDVDLCVGFGFGRSVEEFFHAAHTVLQMRCGSITDVSSIGM
jgi:hypothetical protein